ncbi:MAG TPA: SDR family NAD(P)-dependent oxidoreductase [Nocardioidaceae bacterium]|nr:SDR family NAD(P)-dependent oxidoreductase [Nocardioidaceae bacterium]
MKSLDNKVVVITGAGSGIGRALALKTASKGARLALSDWDTDGLGETSSLVKAAGQEPRTDKLDVRDRAAMAAYATSVAEEFGVVNAIINNAGITVHGNFVDVTYEQFERVIDVDFWGVVNGTKEFLPHLIESGDGHVVNISSIFGLHGMPGQTSYNAAKFAVRGFTESLRMEMMIAKYPVQVTSVHPGGIKTNIVRNAEAAGEEDLEALNELFDKVLANTSAEKAADIIVRGILKNKGKVLVGPDAFVIDKLIRLAGPNYQRVLATTSDLAQKRAAKGRDK